MTLPKFGHRDVRKAALTIRKTGDGLSEALKFEPVALWPGDEVYLVVKAVIVDVQHPAENRKRPSDDDLIRVHIADAVEVAMVAPDDVQGSLAAMEERIAVYRAEEAERRRLEEDEARRREEEAAGVQRLDDALTDEPAPDGEPVGVEA